MPERIRRLVEHAQEFARERGPSDLPTPPAMRLAVLACMDSRLPVFQVLGLEEGEAHVIRNAGGAATDDVLRSLALSQRRLGTDAVVVMHHTQCGMHGFDDDDFRRELELESGIPPHWHVDGWPTAEDGVRRAVRTIRECPWLLHRDLVWGFVYDVRTRELQEVDSPGVAARG